MNSPAEFKRLHIEKLGVNLPALDFIQAWAQIAS
jgi:hypothetical protein